MNLLAVMLASTCGAAGIVLGFHYPLVQPAMAVVFAVVTVVFLIRPYLWILVLPAVLPIVGFAPWTGWLTFEEFDLLVLAAAAGGYLRIAVKSRSMRTAAVRADKTLLSGTSALSTLDLFVVCLFVSSVLVALVYGFLDAGGYTFSWFQGYHESMNSVRLAKGFLAAALLLPVWQWLYRADSERAARLLSTGLLMGLAAASLTTIWERVAFVGLLDFSSDYRTTGLFWEMHVGGAALDGFLALTVPFAMRELLAARTPLHWGVAASVLAIASYACLTTFSRGVYLAVPAGLACLVLLQALQQRHARLSAAVPFAPVPAASGRLAAVLLTTGFGAAAAGMFQTSGYRGVLALLGVMALALPTAQALRACRHKQLVAGFIGGLLLGAMALAMALLLPKGAYIAYALAAAFTLSIEIAMFRHMVVKALAGALALAGLIASATGVVLVATHWGYAQATWPAVAAAAFVVLVPVAGSSSPRLNWPDSIRWQAGLVCAMALLAVTIGIFSGGAYMGDRLATGNRDLDNRFTHWKLGLGMLQSPADWWLGKGLGRYPANYYYSGDPAQHPGDYRLGRDKDNNYLRIAGGLHSNGWDQIFRISQRVSEPGRPLSVRAKVRASKPVTLAFEICEKHLLYSQNCLKREVGVKADAQTWQTIDTELRGDGVYRGRWYAPRLLVFSVAMETRGGVADLDDLALVGPDGQDMLANGDFSDDMARWFSSSDKYHLPWHMKNMALHVLFEQGIVGLLIWCLLIATAFWRLTIGKAKRHPMAPVLAASLVGFLVVGLFDSLLDVPRLATLFYLLVLIGLTVNGGRSPATSSHGIAAMGSVRQPITHGRANKPGRKARKLLATAVATCLIGAAAVALVSISLGRSPTQLVQTTPAEVIRHVKPTLLQHDFLRSAILPPLEFLQAAIERPPPPGPLPSLGKGQQDRSLSAQAFGPTGDPIAFAKTDENGSPFQASVRVNSAEQLVLAVAKAIAGQVIEIEPGSYAIKESLSTWAAGTPGSPIVVRAAHPGEVVLEFDLVQGFHVTKPYWVFENLTIRGVCERDAKCEHAFHIVGAAKGVVLRNNRMEDFNAQVKINGEGGQWPDNGLIQFNTLTNSHPRDTTAPVTPIDLVAASHWQVVDNKISDFVSSTEARVSYGIFMKGAGSGGRVERNLIVCTTKNISDPGVRVGLSWGGGGTDKGSCRDGMCIDEHTEALAANNVIAHCNDAGIDVNNSSNVTLGHNTLINTAGILVRGHSSAVRIHGNLLDGRIRAGDGTVVEQSENEVGSLASSLKNPDRLRLEFTSTGPAQLSRTDLINHDFCDQERAKVTTVGATSRESLDCRDPSR